MANIPPVQRPPGAPVEPVAPRPTGTLAPPTQLMHQRLQSVQDGFAEANAQVPSSSGDDAVMDPSGVSPGKHELGPRLPRSPSPKNARAEKLEREAQARRLLWARRIAWGFLLAMLAFGVGVWLATRSGPPSEPVGINGSNEERR